MRLGGRIEAAGEVLSDILGRHTPANLALRDWGKAHRFAGSADRAAIGNIVHDALRKKFSLSYQMDSDQPRALALGALLLDEKLNLSKYLQDIENDKFFRNKISQDEAKKLNGAIDLDDAPDWIKANIPEWIWPAFENNFGAEAVNEGMALCDRPPLDLRVNSLKAKREDVSQDLNYAPTQISPQGLRIPAITGFERHPNIQSEMTYLSGQIEIQDEGSQLVSQLINAQAEESILDYCAGGGGKSIAMAADMGDRGQIHAFDIDKRRLAPTFQRAQRAGANSIKLYQPPEANLSDLIGKMDRVVIDAPCTGVGTWRRKPDAKWRLSESGLERRMQDQKDVLNKAQAYVRRGGYLIYITCSMLAEENELPLYNFLETYPDFALLSAGEVWEERFGTQAPKPWSEDGCSLTLTPAATQTDGFFFAIMEKING